MTHPSITTFYDREMGERLRREVEQARREIPHLREQVDLLTGVVHELAEIWRSASGGHSIAAGYELSVMRDKFNQSTGKLKKQTQDLVELEERLKNWTVLHRWVTR